MQDTIRTQMENELIQLFTLLEVEWQFHGSQSHWGFYLPERETYVWGRERNDPYPEELAVCKNVVLFQEMGSIQFLAYLLDKAENIHLPHQASRYIAVPPDPMELGIAKIFDKLNIDYKGNGLPHTNATHLDFFIPEANAYIEAKQMPSTRPMFKSLRQLQSQENVLLVQGMKALACLNHFVEIALRKGSIFSAHIIRAAPNRDDDGRQTPSDQMPFQQS